MFPRTHLLFLLLCKLCFSRENSPLRTSRLTRIFSQRVVPTTCPKIRSKSYKGRLDLLFIYAIEYGTESKLDLMALNTAVASHLISVLSDCDANGEPEFATEIEPNSHTLLVKSDGSCESIIRSDTQCVKIRGRVSLYLDGNAAGAEARSFSTIRSFIDDTSLLKQLSGLPIVDSSFVRSLGGKVVVSNEVSEKEDSMKGGRTAIVITATMTSFALAAIFFCGIYRQRPRNTNSPSLKQTIAHLYSRRRRFFENLEDDEDLESSWRMASESAPYERCPPPSITWSVSDLTSDTHSIRSTVQLDRIVEEHCSEEKVVGREDLSPPSQIYRHFDPAELNFVAQWNDACSQIYSSQASFTTEDRTDPFDETEVNRFDSDQSNDCGDFPLRGCQFLPDGSVDGSSTHLSRRGRSLVPLDCSLSPDSTLLVDKKVSLTARDQVVHDHGSENMEAMKIGVKPITSSSATLVYDLPILLWWAKLWIDIQRGRSESRLKSG